MESSTLFVARHKITGLYSRYAKQFLYGNQDWMASTQPSVARVIEELRLADERSSLWESDIQNAEVWVRYDIDRYQQYLPDVEFVAVSLSYFPPSR